MLSTALQNLEEKINQVIEMVELYALQLEDVNDTQAKLQKENLELKQQQNAWEETILGLLGKLEKLQLAEKDKQTQVATSI